jgi:hypothetical protein
MGNGANSLRNLNQEIINSNDFQDWNTPYESNGDFHENLKKLKLYKDMYSNNEEKSFKKDNSYIT